MITEDDRPVDVTEEDSLFSETIQIDHERKPQEVELQFGVPDVSQQMISIEKVTDINQETPGEVQTSSLTIQHEEELKPVEMQIKLPTDGDFLTTKETQVTKTEVRRISVDQIQQPAEMHKETIEIIQKPKPEEVIFKFVSPDKEQPEMESAPKPEVTETQIREQIKKSEIIVESKTKEVDVPVTEISTAKLDVTETLVQSPRPTDEQITVTRDTIVKQTEEVIERETVERQIVVDISEKIKEVEKQTPAPDQQIEISERDILFISEKKPQEKHTEEMSFEIKGKPQEEVQISFQLDHVDQPTEVTQVEIPVVEDTKTEIETFISETEICKEMQVSGIDETHKEEMFLQIEGDTKPKEVEFTVQFQQQEDEQPIAEAATPSTEQITQEMEPQQAGEAPVFTWGLMSLKVMDGEEVKFRCEVKGTPMPEIIWYHDDNVVTENQDFKLTYDIEKGECVLLIVEVFPQDAGEYVCEAVNVFGKDVTRAFLEIECKYEVIVAAHVAEWVRARTPNLFA